MNHWYDNTISQGILKEKYYHKGEKTPQEFMDRVSSIFDPELKKGSEAIWKIPPSAPQAVLSMRQGPKENSRYPCPTAISCHRRRIIWNPSSGPTMKSPAFFLWRRHRHQYFQPPPQGKRSEERGPQLHRCRFLPENLQRYR